jgi:electron-transferring-flavoprotein dehydrogenase
MSEIERDVMEYDVVIVGGGPAGLSCAIRLKQLQPDINVCVLEKSATLGAHALSGAVIEPGPIDQLVPGWRDGFQGICVPAGRDEFSFLTKTRRYKLPTPPQMNNHGNFIVSLGNVVTLLGAKAEALGVDVFAGFAAAQPLFDPGSGAVVGVQIGDMGLDKDGQPGDNFAPGPEIRARTTILAEGCRGSISKQLISRFRLDAGKSPQTYGLGFKELWQLPAGRVEPGLIQHTVGFPMDSKTYGGSFLYQLDQDRIYIGFVVGLDYADPRFKPFEAFQQFKNHPSLKPLFDGGELVTYGARTIVEGGWQSMPTFEMPGALLVGDAGGTLNVTKIKGVHQAVRSGVLAAEHLAEAREPAGFDRRWRGLRGRARALQDPQRTPRIQQGHVDGARQRRARDPHGWAYAVDAAEPCRSFRAAATRRAPLARPRLERSHAQAARPRERCLFRRQHARRIATGAPQGA